MKENYTFYYDEFLKLFCYKPYMYYNQFLLENETQSIIDSVGNHPNCYLIFKYNADIRIRATFIVFDDELEDMDIKCICILFHGGRSDNYCYFYEQNEDLSIRCVQVAHRSMETRIVKDNNAGDDIDIWFEKLCASFDKPINDSITMIYYKENDDCFRLLDMIPSELVSRCAVLLEGDPMLVSKKYSGVNYLFYKSMIDNSYLVARTMDGHNPTDILLEDDLFLRFEIIKNKYQSKTQSLHEELSQDCMHTFLDLQYEYKQCVFELDELFEKYDYIIPYEMYQFLYDISFYRYNHLFAYSEYVNGYKCEDLAEAILKEAISYLELLCTDLLELEQKNDYKEKKLTNQLLSIQAYDEILKVQDTWEEYVSAAQNILSYLGPTVADKAYDYYKKAYKLLESSSASYEYNSMEYYTYYITLYDFLLKYKSSIDNYGVTCDFDIDQKIYECMHNNYRQAQSCSRDKMIVQVNNLINKKHYLEAISLAKEIVDICEERVKNIDMPGIKLSLKNAYDLLLSIPTLPEDGRKVIEDKLREFCSTMTHEDFYCKDNDKEYTLRPQ